MAPSGAHPLIEGRQNGQSSHVTRPAVRYVDAALHGHPADLSGEAGRAAHGLGDWIEGGEFLPGTSPAEAQAFNGPGAMFSSMTSHCLTSFRRISLPSSDLMLSVTDFLFRFTMMKPRESTPGSAREYLPSSPVLGRSTLTTSAPSHARVSV